MASYNNSPGVQLSREQVAQIAYQAGARGSDLEFLVAVPERESSYGPGWHRTDSDRSRLSGDRGLWQINSIWDQQLISAGIIRNKSDLFDPLTNARAAVYVLQKQGRAAWNMSTGGSERNLNMGAAKAAVSSAASKGLLGQDYQGQTTSATGATTGGAQAPAGPFDLPSDAQLTQIGGARHAVFNVGGVQIWYDVPNDGSVNTGGRTFQSMTTEQFFQRFPNATHGGHAEELRLMATSFGSYGQYWNQVLDTVIGKNNPARNDPAVLKVLAEYAGRPDMDRAELQNKLQATPWFQGRTESELAWNSLGEAERRTRTEEMATRMAQQWEEFTGEPIGAADPRITAHLDAVASGKMGFGNWTETVVKPAATSNAESPYSRNVRTEQEAQRERGITIENTTARIRDELERYGLTWDAGTLNHWAKGLVEKHMSDDDLTQMMEQSAQVQYPGLGPLNGADVATLAAPWLATYERVMEKRGSLYTPEIRSALAQGAPVWEMEKELTKSSGWLTTRNADERMHNSAGQLAEMFGY